MSRLHECKITHNLCLLPSHLRTGEIKTVADKMEAIKGADSPRMGTRHTKTIAKTARACGHNYTPTGPWRTRSQTESGNEWKNRNRRQQIQQAKEMRKNR